jgi:ribosome biogenesis GTPase / thiamine phosphate phosphatase
MLEKYGWNDFFKKSFEPYQLKGFSVGRVFVEHTHLYRLYTEFGELLGEVSGKLRHETSEYKDFPSVGDWVVITPRPQEGTATIHSILPRKSKFSRKIAGTLTQEQVIAANIDTLFIVMSLNYDFNLRRLERYLIMAWESGASPVIILNKADLCDDVEEKISQVEAIAFGIPVHAISSVTKQGFDDLNSYFSEGVTVALSGSSGVGKSTIINQLAGEDIQVVKEIRDDDSKGRHTTTHRELILLKQDGLIIDTPGMREFQLWDANEGAQETFTDIESLSKHCRFNDCRHKNEPGCAVKEAINTGTLSFERYENYLKLQKELKYIEEKQNQLLRLIQKNERRRLSKR